MKTSVLQNENNLDFTISFYTFLTASKPRQFRSLEVVILLILLPNPHVQKTLICELWNG